VMYGFMYPNRQLSVSYFFGSEDIMVKLDTGYMASYSSRLIGSPQVMLDIPKVVN